MGLIRYIGEFNLFKALQKLFLGKRKHDVQPYIGLRNDDCTRSDRNHRDVCDTECDSQKYQFENMIFNNNPHHKTPDREGPFGERSQSTEHHSLSDYDDYIATRTTDCDWDDFHDEIDLYDDFL